MKKSTKILLLLSAVLISLGTILMVGGLAAGVQIKHIFQSGLWDTVLYEDTIENKYSPDGRYAVSPADIQQLTISWTDGAISVESYDGTEIQIEESAPGGVREKNRLGFTTEDGLLRIFDYPAQAAVHFSFHRPMPSKNLRIYLPAALAQNLNRLDLNTAGTELDLRDLQVQSLSIDTLDGTISMQDSTVNSLDVDAANANLLLQGTQIHTLTIHNLDGDVTLESSTADDLTMNTMGGNLYGSFLRCPQTVQMESLSGDAELQLPADSQFTATWDSMDGSYASDFSGILGDCTHTVGDGSSQISISTMSGTLRTLYTASAS